MYDVDMTRVDTKLETAFLNESEATLTASEVIRLRRYMKSIKEDLAELNREHLEVVNESVPMDYVRTVLRDNETLKSKLAELAANIQELEYAGKAARCPICFRALGHAQECWIGQTLAPYALRRTDSKRVYA